MTLDIRALLQNRALGVIGATVTDWENNNFVTPSLETPYYKANLKPAPSENLAIDSMASLNQGFFQITLYYPVNHGTIEMETKAEAIIAHFSGVKLTQNNTRVTVLTQPYYTRLEDADTVDRFIGAVTINYEATKY